MSAEYKKKDSWYGMLLWERKGHHSFTANPPPKGEYFVPRKFKYIHEWTLLHDLTPKKKSFWLSLPPAFLFLFLMIKRFVALRILSWEISNYFCSNQECFPFKFDISV